MADTIEPYPIPDAFATKLVRVERVGKATVRLVFSVPDRPAGRGEPDYHVVVAKIVVEEAALPDIILALTKGTAELDNQVTDRPAYRPMHS